MSPIVYGFLGIALGALLPSLWAWLAIVRTEQTEGMVAARLLDSNLELVERAQGRGDLDAALWLQHRPALAKVLDRDAWEVVSRIYRDGGHQGSVAHARIHLKRLVQGKRSIIQARWRQWFGRPCSVCGDARTSSA